MRLSGAVLLVLLLATAVPAQTIHYDGGAFRVSDWRTDRSSSVEDLASLFAVYTGSDEATPLLGTHSIEGEFLVFRPRFPLAAGLRYRAVFCAPASSPIESFVDGPKKEAVATTRVERVYPSDDVWPGNLLRIYVYFSAPMSVGEWKRRIRLIEQDGRPAEAPFLEAQDELWDPGYRRLTIYFDPGRIKRGLVPHKELGPPLVEGRQYTLVVDREFEDDRGIPLKEEFRKSFRVGPAIRKRLDPHEWRMNDPKAGTVEPLAVDFPWMMDVALVQRLLKVRGVDGTVSLERDETRWTYIPDEPWKVGEHHLDIDPTLEDVAGNRTDHVFDLDMSEAPSQPIATAISSLPFRVSP